MDKEASSRKVDTNIIEIKRLLNFLLTNGYKFEGTREAIDGRSIYPDDAIASFSKKISYTDTHGNWINDSGIKVSIQFEKRADYKNFKKKKNKDEDDIYIGEPDTFITGLIEENSLEPPPPPPSSPPTPSPAAAAAAAAPVEEIKDPKYSIGGRTKNKKMKIRKNKSSKKNRK